MISRRTLLAFAAAPLAPAPGGSVLVHEHILVDFTGGGKWDADEVFRAAKESKYKAHGDIVVFVRPGEIGVIGGNVGDSVSLKTLKIDGSGYLTDKTQPWFCVLENRLPES